MTLFSRKNRQNILPEQTDRSKLTFAFVNTMKPYSLTDDNYSLAKIEKENGGSK